MKYRSVLVLAVLNLLCILLTMPGSGQNPNVDLTGVWSCDGGGTYYIQQIGNIIWWYGEPSDSPGGWSNVAKGTISGNTINLDWADVSKGNARGNGILVLSIVLDDKLTAVQKPRDFGGSTWMLKAKRSGVASPQNPQYIPSTQPSSGPTANIDLTGVWKCDEGGTYYIRQIGNTVWWYGEPADSPGDWSNVAKGTISGSTIDMEWSDVPKGGHMLYGTLTISIESNDELTATQKTGNFGGSTWKRNAKGPGPTNQNIDLTGVWSCDDTGTYYIRQIGNTIWWDGDEDSPNLNWANVARGTINGNTVTLDYADVPEADATGYGTLVLDIVSNDELKAREKPESFGGSHWTRSSNKPQSTEKQPTPTGSSSTSTIPGLTTKTSGNQGSLNPWEDPSVRQLIDEWLQQQDRCVKKVDPGTHIDTWGRLQGINSDTKISNAGRPDDCPIDWDNYHYLWFKNWCPEHYSYRVQDYINLRQSGSSFDELAKCKGKNDDCYRG